MRHLDSKRTKKQSRSSPARPVCSNSIGLQIYCSGTSAVGEQPLAPAL